MIKKKKEKKIFKPRFRQARVFVHFHSFSCVATLTSSITKGTHPPKTYILYNHRIRCCKAPNLNTKNINTSNDKNWKLLTGCSIFSLVCDSGSRVKTSWKWSCPTN